MRKHIRKEKDIPAWVKPGAIVNYYGHLGAVEPDVWESKIRSKPWNIGNAWCVLIEGISGGVSIGCLEHITHNLSESSKGEA